MPSQRSEDIARDILVAYITKSSSATVPGGPDPSNVGSGLGDMYAALVRKVNAVMNESDPDTSGSRSASVD